MPQTYYTMLTDAGARYLAIAQATGSDIKLKQMAVGDGGGSVPSPNSKQTALINQKYIADLSSLDVDETNSAQYIAEMVIREDVGDFWIREAGLFTDDGTLFAVCNYPETYKPIITSGASRLQTIRMVVIISSTQDVTLTVDPSITFATRNFVESSTKKDSKVITWANRLQEDKNKELISAEDCGAIAYDDMDYATATNGTVTMSDSAFSALENRVKKQPVNLHGKYFCVTSVPRGNYYYNGYFVLNGLILQQSLHNEYRNKWCSGAGEGFVYDILQPVGHLGENFIQSIAYDKFDNTYWALSNVSADDAVQMGDTDIDYDRGVLAQYRRDGADILTPVLTSAMSDNIGHQGLGIQHVDGVTKLWIGVGEANTPRGDWISRVTPPTNGGDVTEIEKYRVMSTSDNINTNYHNSVSVSPAEDLVVVANINYNQNQILIKIYDINTFEVADADYSDAYAYKWYLQHKHDGTDMPLQSIVTDGSYVYVLFLQDLHVYTLTGELVYKSTHKIGVNTAAALSGQQHYEPEALIWLPRGNDYTLGMSIAMGYTGSMTDMTDVRSNYIMTSLPFVADYNYPNYRDIPAVISKARHDVVIPKNNSYIISEQKDNYYKEIFDLKTKSLKMINHDFDDDTHNFSVTYSVAPRSFASLSSSNDVKNPTINFYNQDDTSAWNAGSIALFVHPENASESVPIWMHAGQQKAIFAGESGSFSLGTSAYLFSSVYAQNGSIQTSDINYKQDIADLTQKEINVAIACSKLIKKFKFKDAVAKKGESARYHVGLIAQEIKAAFEYEGLDGTRYGILCYDSWDAQDEVSHIDDCGNKIIEQAALAAGSRWAVRADQLSLFICAGLETVINNIDARITAIESTNS